VESALASSTRGLKSLLRVGKRGEVPVDEYLAAVESLAPAYEALGVMFSIASNEITRNVRKLRVNAKRNPRATSLQELVEADLRNGLHENPDSTYVALRWLGFSLHFVESLFERISSGECALAKCTERAYNDTLRPHHGHALQLISKSVLRVVPVSRDSMLERIGLEEARAMRLLSEWANAAKRVRSLVGAVYSTRGGIAV